MSRWREIDKIEAPFLLISLHLAHYAVTAKPWSMIVYSDQLTFLISQLNVTQSVSSTFLGTHNRAPIRSSAFELGKYMLLNNMIKITWWECWRIPTSQLTTHKKKSSRKLYGSQLCVVRYYTVLADFLTVTQIRCHQSDHEVFACHALHFSFSSHSQFSGMKDQLNILGIGFLPIIFSTLQRGFCWLIVWNFQQSSRGYQTEL